MGADSWGSDQLSLKMTERCGKLKKNWILLENKYTVHIFINPSLTHNIRLVDETADLHSSGGTIHFYVEGTLPDFGDVLIFKNGFTKILYFALVCKKNYVLYDNEK